MSVHEQASQKLTHCNDIKWKVQFAVEKEIWISQMSQFFPQSKST